MEDLAHNFESAGLFRIDVVFEDSVGLSKSQMLETFSVKDLRAGGGECLGMWNARNIITQSKGSISAKSTMKGSTSINSISISFKLSWILGSKRSMHTAALSKASLPSIEFEKLMLPPKDVVCDENYVTKILIVDDSQLCRRSTSKLVKCVFEKHFPNRFVKLDHADDGHVAVECVKKSIKERREYDIIFMDNTMVKMNGPDATKAIRKLGYNEKIYALTGNVFEDDKRKFLESGVTAFYEKPLTAANLSGCFCFTSVHS